ncbi:MAG TPA: sensor domain-containing diguanylate cyclase [Acidimicrobiales bacterium]|nr:sensor domain-containing diguanylate cyclase [Acidimicrobiales bacterium]
MPADGRLRRIDRLRLIIEVQRLVRAATLDGDEMARVVTERAQTVTGAHGAVLAMLDGDELVCRSASGSVATAVGVRVPLYGTLSGLCVRTASRLRCDDSELDPRVERDACRRWGVRSLAAVPLLHNATAAGVLAVVAEESDHFEEADADALELVATLLAGAGFDAFDHQPRSHAALHDSLTGLPNRVLLMDRLQQALNKVRRLDTGVAVFFVDLDGFSAVNESYGHDTGDDLLQQVAKALTETLRGGDTLARYGGDEFVVVCENADEAVGAAVTDRITEAVRRVATSAPVFASVTATVGMAWGAGPNCDADELLAAADASVYQAKRARRPGG